MQDNPLTNRASVTRLKSYWALIVLIAPLLALKLHLVFLQAVNWDEFLFLAKIYSYLRDTPTSALQTGYIHAFIWLTYLPGNEIDQIIVARLTMYLLQAATCFLIFLIAKKMCRSIFAAMAGVYAYIAFTYTIEHGTSFRADPIATFLLIFALYFLVQHNDRIWRIFSAGIVTALAGIITIKSIFYLPTLVLAAIYLRRDTDTAHSTKSILAFATSVSIGFIVFYAAHHYMITPPPSYSATNMLTGSADKVLVLDRLFPGAVYLIISLHRHTTIWLMMALGLLFAIATSARHRSLRMEIGVVGLALPLTTLFFYRNAYPYYYVFALASPVLLASWGIARLERFVGTKNTFYLHATLIATFSASTIGIFDHYRTIATVDRTIEQRRIIDGVHQIFPQPMRYIDRASTISSFPKFGFFMSTWGLENYREANTPIIRQLLIEQSPVFLIADDRINPAGSETSLSLSATDIDTLRQNYIPHWGAIWVAGKRFDFDNDSSSRSFEILIPGVYTIESNAPVSIDHIWYEPHTTITLSTGPHTIESMQQNAAITLRWGDDLYRPDTGVQPPVLFPYS